MMSVGQVQPGPASVEHAVALRRVRDTPAQLVSQVAEDVGARDRTDEIAWRRTVGRIPGSPACDVVHQQITVVPFLVGLHDSSLPARVSNYVPQERARRPRVAGG